MAATMSLSAGGMIWTALALYTRHVEFTAPFPYMAEALAQLQARLDAQWTESERTILPFPAFRFA